MPPTQETRVTAVSDSERELWCLANNDVRPFLIRISPTRYIYDLEELVLTKCTGGRIRSINPKDLNLIKVRISQASCSQV